MADNTPGRIIAPANGSSFPINEMPRFEAEGGQNYNSYPEELIASSSPAVEAGGLLAGNDYQFGDYPVLPGKPWSVEPEAEPTSHNWRPGTLYWQMWCPRCYLGSPHSPVWSFTILPATPPELATPADGAHASTEGVLLEATVTNIHHAELEAKVRSPSDGATLLITRTLDYTPEGSGARSQWFWKPEWGVGTFEWTVGRNDCGGLEPCWAWAAPRIIRITAAPPKAPPTLSVATARGEIPTAVRSHTLHGAHALHVYSCEQRTASVVRCEISWRSSLRVHANTWLYRGRLELIEHGSFSSAFSGTRATYGCIRAHGLARCRRTARW